MSYLAPLIDTLFPPCCAACGRRLAVGESCLCTLCLYHLPRTYSWQHNDNSISRLFWGRLKLEYAASFLYFQKGTSIQELIHQFKYNQRMDIGEYLGWLYGLALATTAFSEADALVPVPINRQRRRKRGYNQSEIIANGMAKALNKPVLANALVRKGHNKSQTQKGRFDRWLNVEHEFTFAGSHSLANQHILLVDDVITTGATIEACANVLQSNGCSLVSVASLALAVK